MMSHEGGLLLIAVVILLGILACELRNLGRR